MPADALGWALVGGALVGLSATVLWLGLGRIAGISSLVGELWQKPVRAEGWRWCFLLGLLASPWLIRPVWDWPDLGMQVSSPWLVVAGLLVGVGTRLGGGCTSGHGVCGLSRGSLRSLVATGCFMLAGFVTVALLRHGSGWMGS